MFLLRICKALSDAGVAYAIAGGYAVALHGAVRGTVDVDLVIRLKRVDFEKTEAALKGLGLQPRLPVSAAEVFEFREEYAARRNLLAWSFSNPSNPLEIVDILTMEDLGQLKTVQLAVGAAKLRVVSLPDLIRMKKRSGRPQDLEDVSALERVQANR